MSDRDALIGRMNDRGRAIERLRGLARLSEETARTDRQRYNSVRNGACYRCEGEKLIDTSRADDQPARMEDCPVCGGTGLWP